MVRPEDLRTQVEVEGSLFVDSTEIGPLSAREGAFRII